MKRVGFFTPLLAVLAILQGCSPSNPGVARLGNNQYILTRQAASGFHGLGAVKIDALREAENHCMVLGQTLLVTDTLDSRPPYLLGNLPRTEITFSCVLCPALKGKKRRTATIYVSGFLGTRAITDHHAITLDNIKLRHGATKYAPCTVYSAAILLPSAASTLTAENLNSGILP